jgi:putative restriction endonuclease
MHYWWVNHKQTMRQEVEGGFLWSPKRKTNGARNQFYDNMRKAAPGDVVLSYANGRVSHVGTVVDFASTATKPSSFGVSGYGWDNDGWRLPVEWGRLGKPVRPKSHIRDLRQWLPQKNSPIRPATGDGNQGVYLAAISEAVFDFVLDRGGNDPGRWKDSIRRPRPPGSRENRDAENRTAYDAPISDSEGEQTVKVRRGQGLFRVRVSKIEKKGCRLTGVRNPRLLRASHIKPWRSCTTYERLDGANGLLLTPHVDHLFDNGYISFEDSGDVKVSSRLTAAEIDQLGLADACGRNVGTFSERQKAYLAQHRKHVFKP